MTAAEALERAIAAALEADEAKDALTISARADRAQAWAVIAQEVRMQEWDDSVRTKFDMGDDEGGDGLDGVPLALQVTDEGGDGGDQYPPDPTADVFHPDYHSRDGGDHDHT